MTTLEIWNWALGMIGTRTVASQTEHTPEAIQCGLFWDSARRQALRDYPWSFAQSRVRLPAVGLPDVWRGVWQFAYGLPALCLKAQAVFTAGSERKHPFKIVRADDGTALLLCNVEHAILEYTQDVTDAARFDDSFGHLLARKLATMIAVPLLKNNAQKVQELEQLYRAALPVAHDASASEGKDKPEQDSWIIYRNSWS